MSAGVDNGVATLNKVERGLPDEPVAGIPIEISLASIAISLRRIADSMEGATFDAQQTRYALERLAITADDIRTNTRKEAM